MPRKKRPAKATIRTTVNTAAELAAALGVHANTVSQWKPLGMPAQGPRGPYEVIAVYAWAKWKGFDAQLPRDPALAKLCQAATKARGADVPPPSVQVSQDLIAIGRELGVETPREGDLEEDDRILAWQRWASTVSSLQDIRQKRRDFIPRAEVRPYLQQLAASVHAADTDLPAAVAIELDALKLPAETLEAVREAVRKHRALQREALVREADLYATRCLRGDQVRQEVAAE